jgi:flagellar basal-body rod protein FlgG
MLFFMCFFVEAETNLGVKAMNIAGQNAETQIWLGVQSGGVYRYFTQGDPIQTNNYLDCMVEGEGFFQVTQPDGSTAYTRVGAFKTALNNEIVMPITGCIVQPGLILPTVMTDLRINLQGQVDALVAGSTKEVPVGQFQLATFSNPSGLKAIGDSMFVQTAASGTPNTGTPGSGKIGTIKQGWIEGANVNAVE